MSKPPNMLGMPSRKRKGHWMNSSEGRPLRSIAKGLSQEMAEDLDSKGLSQEMAEHPNKAELEAKALRKAYLSPPPQKPSGLFRILLNSPSIINSLH